MGEANGTPVCRKPGPVYVITGVVVPGVVLYRDEARRVSGSRNG